ncbi:unnamed protein product [Coregonus sp. 'balchen']|nr:unnamed protein product [Coregonus sp. 'balchen']
MAYDMESMPSSPAVTTPSVTFSVAPNKASRSSDTPATPLALSESEPPSPQEDHSDDYSPPSKSKKVLTKHPKSSKRGRLRKGEEKRREPAEATPFVVTSVLQAPTHAPNPATQPPPGLTEEEIKTDMMVLARRRTNTWHQGRITEIKRTVPEVWEDIENEANREFIKDYIKVYPYPPMAQYRPGQLVNVEFEGVQRRTEVEQIDCSLLCVVFKDDEHKEWVYRGSLRLEHMANIKKRAEEAKDKPAVTRPNTGGSVSTTNTIHQTSMANASKPHVNPSAPLGRPYGQDRTTDKSSVITAKGSVTFTHHRCCPACLDCIRSKTYFHIFYQSPCGLSLSNMTAVQDYLQQTRCDFLFLDMFCLDPFVSVTTTHQPRPYKINILDLTLGRENQPLSCINELNNIRPISVIYNKQRVAASGVSLNTSSDFLVGCDCTDGCRDSIYECNSLCRCDPRMCSNRVVQHGIQLRLQLFMTVGKSWGIRCLDDVAKGTFICTYTGIIMNKKSLGTEGNMYMVNLNHIEGAENKEGYESEARRSDKESGSEEEPVEDVNSEHDDCDGGDDLSNDEEEKGNHEKVQRRMKKNNSDDEDEEQLSDDNYEDKDYDVSEDDGDSEFRHNVSSMERSYITRRHAKILQEAKKSGSDDKSSDQQDGKAEGNDKEASNATRRFFDGEESCYIIDAKLEGNVGRYLNVSHEEE